jgi:hypothetical protein
MDFVGLRGARRGLGGPGRYSIRPASMDIQSLMDLGKRVDDRLLECRADIEKQLGRKKSGRPHEVHRLRVTAANFSSSVHRLWHQTPL